MPIWLHLAFGVCLVVAASLFITMAVYGVGRPVSGPASLQWPKSLQSSHSHEIAPGSVGVTAVFPGEWRSKIEPGMPLHLYLEFEPDVATVIQTRILQVTPIAVSAFGPDQTPTHEFVRVDARIDADPRLRFWLDDSDPPHCSPRAVVHVENASLLRLLLQRLAPRKKGSPA